MKMRTALFALAAFASPAIAADYSLDLKPENTKIQWTLSDVIHTINGTFPVRHGHIGFDPATGKTSGQVLIDVASGGSGNNARDRSMHENVLESAKFPEAVFVPSRIEGAVAIPGNSKVKVRGTFTIHGAAHEIAMDADVTATSDRIHVTMQFEIPYVAWGMKDPSTFLLKVSKSVRMSIDVSAPLHRREN